MASRRKAQKTSGFLLFSLYNRMALPYYQVDQERVQTFSLRFVCASRSGAMPSVGNLFSNNPRPRENQMPAEIKRMTQTAIVRELAETTGVNNKVARHFMDSLAELAVRETKKNGVFILPGIGRLVRAERKARVGRNPATGEAIKIPAKKVVKFRLAKSVKDAIVPPKKAAGK
jgi:DNA-binding protein HU-beta